MGSSDEGSCKPPYGIIFLFFLLLFGVTATIMFATGVVNAEDLGIAYLFPGEPSAPAIEAPPEDDLVADDTAEMEAAAERELLRKEEEKKRKIEEIRARWAREKDEKRARLADNSAREETPTVAEAETEESGDSNEYEDSSYSQDNSPQITDDSGSAGSDSDSTGSPDPAAANDPRQEKIRMDRIVSRLSSLKNEYRSLVNEIKRRTADNDFGDVFTTRLSGLEFSIEVKKTDPFAKPWNSDGTLPDLLVTIEHPVLGVKVSEVHGDSASGNFTFELGGTRGAYLVKVWNGENDQRNFIDGCIVHYPPLSNPRVDPSTNLYKTSLLTLKVR